MTFSEVHDPRTDLTAGLTLPDWAAVDNVVDDDRVATLGLATHAHRAVVQALTQRGVAETGEDRGVPLERYVRYFIPRSGPLPWCAFFVSWAFDTTGDRNLKVAWGNAGYVGSIRDWAGRTKRLVAVPQHGDIFGVGDQHTGLGAGANPEKGAIWTIEGNYSDRVAQRLINYRPAGLWFARL